MEEKETYYVDVKQVGHWWERYSVEADSLEEAKKNWSEGEFIEAYEHNVFETTDMEAELS